MRDSIIELDSNASYFFTLLCKRFQSILEHHFMGGALLLQIRLNMDGFRQSMQMQAFALKKQLNLFF
jgi:hypothetical protein